MRRRRTSVGAVLLLMLTGLLGLVKSAQAGTYAVKIWTDGITPMVLQGSMPGTGVNADYYKAICVTSDGYLVVPMGYRTGSNLNYHWEILDPTLDSPNTNITSALVASDPFLSAANSTLYTGSTIGPVATDDFTMGIYSMTSNTTAANTIITAQGGNFRESMLQANDGATYSATNGKIAQVGKWSGGPVTYPSGMTIFGSDGAGGYDLLAAASGISQTAAGMTTIRKYDLGSLTGQTTSTAGRRASSNGGFLTLAGATNPTNPTTWGLAPSTTGYAVTSAAINPYDGYLYLLCNEASHVYLSAVNLTWGTTSANSAVSIVNLNGVTNGQPTKYEDLTALNPSLTSAWGLAFSSPTGPTDVGNTLYITDNTTDQKVWEFAPSASATPAIYNLASTFATGRLLGGQQTSITSTITNVGGATADLANYAGLAAVASSGAIDLASGSGSVARGGSPGSFVNTYTASGLTGPVAIAPVVGSVTNATIGGNANLGTVSPVTVNVLAPRTIAAATVDFGKVLLNAQVTGTVTLDSTYQPDDTAFTRVTVGGATVGDLTMSSGSTIFNGSNNSNRTLSGTVKTMTNTGGTGNAAVASAEIAAVRDTTVYAPVPITYTAQVGWATAAGTSFDPTQKLSASVSAGGRLANLSSQVNLTTSPGAAGTTATLLNGTISIASTVSMDWRQHTAAEYSNGLVSDVVHLDGVPAATQYVLQMTYNPSDPLIIGKEQTLVAGNALCVTYSNAGQWANAILGNTSGSNNPSPILAAWNSGDGLGSWGVDTANHDVWAVVNQPSDFAVAVLSPSPAVYKLVSVVGSSRLMPGRQTSITSTITNVGSPLVLADSLNYSGLTASASSGTVDPGSGSGGPLINNGGSGSFVNNYTAPGSSGPVTITPVVTSASNATVVDNAELGAILPVTVNVLTPRSIPAPIIVDFGKVLLNAQVSVTVTLNSANQPDDTAFTRVTVGGATVGDLAMSSDDTVFNGSTLSSRTLSGTFKTMTASGAAGNAAVTTAEANAVHDATAYAPVPVSYKAQVGLATAAGTGYDPTQKVSASVLTGGSLANLSSQVNIAASPGAVGTTATLLSGTISSATTVSMNWRQHTAAEYATGLGSDVVHLDGIPGTTQYVLQMTYNPSDPWIAGKGQTLASLGSISLDYNNGTQWVNAILGNAGGSKSVAAPLLGAWNSGDSLGTWGVDTANHDVWAVLNNPARDYAVGSGLSFTPVGYLAGGTYSSNYAVSADGSTVVGESNRGSDGTTQAVVWTKTGGLTALGELPGGTAGSTGRGASQNGAVITGWSDFTSGQQAFRWTQAGGMVGLGSLPSDSPLSQGISVNADGSVIAGYSNSGPGAEAFRWTQATGMVGLGALSGGKLHSYALRVSDDGTTLVGASDSASGLQAFRWTEGTGMVGLGVLPGAATSGSEAESVSNDGSVVVGWSYCAGGRQAWRWTPATGMVALGDFPGGNLESYAYGVSASGSYVVGAGSTSSGYDAFIWDSGHGLRSIKQMMTNSGVNMTGWTLTAANAVSEDGRIVVGTGIAPNGWTEGWVAVIPEQVQAVVPEPATLALLGLGGVGILGRMGRRRARAK